MSTENNSKALFDNSVQILTSTLSKSSKVICSFI